eukprot:TRINITY_DN2264_c0_g1_i1.p1 TRINITY_DN2264_c0_g1~~TRINITY_DN2264_c0_g1_i1.p1  ORF type:complete len:660 (+),score=203.82 TRINITY_DN2264_c0_g1_i1:77-2056(+)
MEDALKDIQQSCANLSDVSVVIELFDTIHSISEKYHQNPQEYPDLSEKLHTASSLLEEIVQSRGGCFCCFKKDISSAQLQDIRQAHDQIITILDTTSFGGRGTPPKVFHPDVEAFWDKAFGDDLVIKTNRFVKAVVSHLIDKLEYNNLEKTALKQYQTHLYAYADGYLMGERTMVRKEELSSLLDGLTLRESFENFHPVEEKKIQAYLSIFQEERSMVSIFEALSNRIPHSCNISRLIDLIANLLNSDDDEVSMSIEEEDIERDNIEILVNSIRRATITSLQFNYYLLKLILIKSPENCLDRIRDDLNELKLPSLIASHLVKYKENAKIIQNICSCITYLSIVPHNIKQSLREQQVLKALVECIEYYGVKEYDEATVVLPCIFEAVRHAVCGIPLSRQLISENNGDGMIVTCLNRFGNSSEIVIKGCGAIQNIVCMNVVAKEKLNNPMNDVPDFAQVLINLLQNTVNEKNKTKEVVSDEIEAICRAMRNFVAHNKTGKNLLFSHGIVNLLEQVIIQKKDNIIVIGRICSVIENLGTKNDTRPLFNVPGFFKILPEFLINIEKLENRRDFVDVKKFVISALKTLGCYEETLRGLKNHGFLNYLTKLVELNENDDVTEIAKDTLEILKNRFVPILGEAFFQIDEDSVTESVTESSKVEIEI